MAQLPAARTVRLIAVSLLGLTMLLLLGLQFTATHTWSTNGGADEGGWDGSAGLWGYHERSGDLSHDSGSWFDDYQQEDGTLRDGIASLRAAAILGTIGLVAMVAATILLLLDRRWTALGLAAVGTIGAIAATNLNGSGMMAFANVHVDRAFGYGLGILSGFTGVIGTILTTLPAPALGVRGALDAWAAGETIETKRAKAPAKSAKAPTTAKTPAKKPTRDAVAGPFNMRFGSAVALAIAVLLLGITQFVPWAGISGDSGEASFSVQARTWEFEAGGSFGNMGGSDTVSWYDPDMDGEDGVTFMRIGAPLLALALTGVLVAAALVLMDSARAGAIVATAGTALTILATIFLGAGSMAFFDGDADRGAGLVLGILAIVAGTLGSFAAVLPSQVIGLKQRMIGQRS